MEYQSWADGMRYETHHGRVVLSHADRPAHIAAMFDEAVARRGGEIAMVDGDLRLTYADVADRADRCATRLLALGIEPGDRVVILLDNRADYMVLLVATARIGAICVPGNIRQRAPETAYVLNDCTAAAIIYEDDLAEHLPAATDAPSVRHWLPYSVESAAWGETVPDVAAIAACGTVHEDDPFCILYTSGTTGKPKGAVLTHFGLITNAIGAQNHLRLRDGDAMVLSVPASHVTGIELILLTAIRIAGKVVAQRGFKARAFLEIAEREGMSYAIMVPAMYKLCLLDPDFARFDLSAWRVGAFGGAPMPEATIAELAEHCPQLTLVNIYGATETSSPAVMMPLGEGRERSDVVGRALPYAEIIVVDDDGRQVPPGEQGEIWIAGPMTIPQYWNNPEATTAGFTGGYWRSGDIGVMDADGYLRVLDRKKDMINRGGFKIYSVEVENTLMAHDAVTEAGVVGRPCEVLGERVVAFAVARDGVTGEELRNFCAANLSDYKVPDQVHVVEGPLPRNPNGKLLKTALRDWLADYPV